MHDGSLAKHSLSCESRVASVDSKMSIAVIFKNKKKTRSFAVPFPAFQCNLDVIDCCEPWDIRTLGLGVLRRRLVCEWREISIRCSSVVTIINNSEKHLMVRLLSATFIFNDSQPTMTINMCDKHRSADISQFEFLVRIELIWWLVIHACCERWMSILVFNEADGYQSLTIVTCDWFQFLFYFCNFQIVFVAMPSQRSSLVLLVFALANIFIVAQARFDRSGYLDETPENINPDDMYNEMVRIEFIFWIA